MELRFPEAFIFGTSTAACQIETAFEHDWSGHIARDGEVFDRTTDHELRFREDAEIISGLAPSYRMSLMWSRLQRSPLGPFDEQTKKDYHQLLQDLSSRGVKIMMVLHHFANPTWFAALGGWNNQSNISLWVDYARKVVDEFGHYVSMWNTFNEPNLYVSMGWIAGEFPPYQRNLLAARRVMQHLGEAHKTLYEYIRNKYPDQMVGISHNCAVFAGDNWIGRVPAKIVDAVYMEWAPKQFTPFDFFGMSYYARIGYDPFPTTYLLTPQKLKRKGKAHDDMWEYYPQGLATCMTRYWEQYGKPIIITENGICTEDDTKRVRAIYDYLTLVHQAIQQGIDVRGYFHWSTWDNFEWSLGPSYRFGLYGCDPDSKERVIKKSGEVYSRIAHSRSLQTDPGNRISQDFYRR